MLSYSKKISALAFLISLPASSAFALDEIYSPNAEKGELSLEYTGTRTFDSDPAKDNAREHQTTLEYGLTDRLMVEASGVFARDAGPAMDTRLDAREVEGRYQFFERGQNWLDSGLLVAYHMAQPYRDPDSIEVKLLLEKDTGQFTHKANIGFEQAIGAYSGGTGGPDYVFLWGSRYRMNEMFEPGFEIQSDFGQHNRFGPLRDQEHYVGPAIYGRLFDRLHYEGAYLFGATQGAAVSACRMLLEYEMHF